MTVTGLEGRVNHFGADISLMQTYSFLPGIAPLLIAACVCLHGAAASAAGTGAGVLIDNVATASFANIDGTVTTLSSNMVTLRIDELLDIAIATRDAADVAAGSGATDQPLAFSLTNAGNGPEAFLLSVGQGGSDVDFNPLFKGLAMDGNANGIYDPGVDPLLGSDRLTPIFQPGQSRTLFVLCDIPVSANEGDRGGVTLTGQAQTGTGRPGTAFDGRGVDGSAAVVGATGAQQDGPGQYRVARPDLRFTKSATVTDGQNGNAVSGATLHYVLDAQVASAGALSNLEISDLIPVGTTYLPGSLLLDTRSLSDASDGDVGDADGQRVRVKLGTVAGGVSHRVEFRVTLN